MDRKTVDKLADEAGDNWNYFLYLLEKNDTPRRSIGNGIEIFLDDVDSVTFFPIDGSFIEG